MPSITTYYGPVGNDYRTSAAGDPLPTITTENRHGLLSGVLVGTAHGEAWANPGLRAWPLSDPLGTVSASGDRALLVANLIRADMHSAAARNGIRDVAEPLATVTGNGGFAAVTAFLTQFNSRDIGGRLTEPLRCAPGVVKQGVVTGWLIPHHGEREGQAARSREVTAPYPTVTGSNRGGDLVVAHLDRQHGSSIAGRSIAEPLATAAAQGGGGHSAVVASYLTGYYSQGGGQMAGLADPALTITGKARLGHVAAWLEQANTGMVGHDAREPASTIVLKGCTQRLVEALLVWEGGPAGRRSDVLAFLWAHFGEPTTEEWLDPWATARGRLRFGYVEIGGLRYRVADIGLRMLRPRELLGAMGMPPGFDLERTAPDERGVEHPISITDQTHMTGNMVPKHMAEAHMAVR